MSNFRRIWFEPMAGGEKLKLSSFDKHGLAVPFFPLGEVEHDEFGCREHALISIHALISTYALISLCVLISINALQYMCSLYS